MKPAFQTRAFAEASVAYRDAVLSGLDDLPAYRRGTLDLPPAEDRELRVQVETFDVVAPRLAVLFELVDRSMNGGDVGSATPDERAATAPFPGHLDAARGAEPSMISAEDVAAEAADAVDGIRSFHGFDDGLPSIYRCLAQWPGFLVRLWDDLEPSLDSSEFDAAVDAADDVVGKYVDELAYRPALSPDALTATGFDPDAVDEVAGLFREFNTGPVETVLPALPAFADTLGVAGERRI
ncbi:halocarboxylic acid dehydrogenase DehI family protein [Halorarum halophilum]|uniref:halocarboxylic acid dehydrogenase DehI family protein n=1 Tax=Halorarum halophilum TaxID=2743090 RepID=UPI001C4F931F|nr:halocarboxylic acid dehydrogenase DehI family protein [Halobaculum halophilum]